MKQLRVISGAVAGGLLAAGVLVAPALLAQPNPAALRLAASPVTGIGAFTPAAADPRLAAVVARSGIDSGSFRFTPADSRRSSGPRSVTVALRARGPVAAPASSGDSAAVAIAPIAYNLGVSVGWRRFAVTGDVARVDLGVQAGGREPSAMGLGMVGIQPGSRARPKRDRIAGDMPRLVQDEPSYSIDVGGSYAITRNLAVTAGVRYNSERERLPRLNDNLRDSQAVYVGTAFRF